MKYLIFFDNTGRIYFTMSIDETPSGLEKFAFIIPEGKIVERMDVTDPSNPVPVLIDQPVDTTAQDITDLQNAVAEIYEMIIGQEA
jgi:hypothetical protein